MVPAVVVVLGASVVCAVAFVPAVCKLRHGLRLLPVEAVKEPVVDHLAVVSGPVGVDADRPSDLRLMCGHDVDQVAEAFGVVVASVQPFESDVDVDPAAS